MSLETFQKFIDASLANIFFCKHENHTNVDHSHVNYLWKYQISFLPNRIAEYSVSY